MEYLNLFVQIFAFMSAVFVMSANITGTLLLRILAETLSVMVLIFLGVIWLKGLGII